MLFLDHPPPVPALIRFPCFTATHAIMKGIMGGLCALREGEREELQEEDVVGLDTQRAYLQQDLIRFCKQALLSAVCSPDKLTVCSLTLQPRMA